MTPYPLLFQPIFREKVWGGRALESLGKPLPPSVPIGESWELADLPESVEDGRSVIANGPLQGMTLREAMDRHETMILGTASRTQEGGFPLLIKYLDARENLSVQVHPSEAYVQKHPETQLKSEAWVVLQAESGAVIYRGVKGGVTRAQFGEDIEDGSVVDDLCEESAVPGRCYYLPSGTVHALGAGIVVAEVQTPSDTTFRLYDWARTDRTLHVPQGLACMDFSPPPPPGPLSTPIEVEGIRTTLLTETTHFLIERVEIECDRNFEIVVNGLPEVWMILDGMGEISGPKMPMMEVENGQTLLLPAALEGSAVRARSPLQFLRVSLPSPLKGKIA